MTFVAPDGEEIKTKRQLDKYLKAHPGTLSAGDFEWGVAGMRWECGRTLSMCVGDDGCRNWFGEVCDVPGSCVMSGRGWVWEERLNAAARGTARARG